jgi:hypothetical protein
MQSRVLLSISPFIDWQPSLSSMLRRSNHPSLPATNLSCPEEGEIVMAQTARNNEAEKATDNVAELGKRTADKGADVAREATDRTESTTRRGFETAQRTAGAALEVERVLARRSAEGATEISQAFAELAKEQARSNLEAFQALTRAVDWDQVSRIQSELLRESVERTAEFTRRYFEVVQAVIASAASVTKEQARKAA